jgi:hypothetical protein
VAVLIGFLAATVFVFGPLARTRAQEGAVTKSRAQQLTDLKLKFDGARSCGGKNCHDKAGSDSPPTERGHEYTIWNEKDKHHEAFKTLSKKESTDIGTKLKIADVKSSDRCLSCHALNVDASLQGQKFSLTEGNTCTQCHGPSEKWYQAHSEKGWVDKQRKAIPGHDALLKQTGIYDTKSLVARAEICVSCHLAIDADLVAAGHPQPWFDLDFFSFNINPHWPDAEGYQTTKVWMAGQVVAVEDSMKQLAVRAAAGKDTKDAMQQAMAHLTVFKPAAAAIGIDVSGMNVNAPADAANVAKLAGAAKEKVEAFDPTANKKATLQMLNAIAAEKGMAAKYGQHGKDQQACAIYSLFNSYAKGEKLADAKKDEVNKLIEGGLLPPDNAKMSADDFDKGIAAVRAKLPAP